MSRSNSPKRRREVQPRGVLPPDLYCPSTGKRAYRSRTRAKRKLKEVNASRRKSPHETRPETGVYECPHCGMWHLTSQVQR